MEKTKEELILYEVQDGIAVVRLNNPPHNIFDRAMSSRMEEILTQIESDTDLRVVIFTSVGKTFNAGSDMREILDYIESGTYIDDKMVHELRNRDRIAAIAVPTIAAVDNQVYGGGFEMILSCDMIIAAPDVEFCMATADIGSFPGAGGGPRLVRLIGRSRALEHMYFSRKMTSAQALDWGLVNAIAEGGSALELALEWAGELAKKPGISMRSVKELVLGMTSPDDGYLFDLQQRISGKVIEAGKLEEGIRFFFAEREKRKKISG